MKSALIILAITCGWVCMARGEDLTTLTGRTYVDVAVERYDWEGIYIRHAGGIAKVSYLEIPAEMREYYRQLAPHPDAGEVSVPPAPVDLGPNDLTTKTGAVYRNAKVRRTEVDAVTVQHDGGLAKISFADIPEELHARFRTSAREASETPPGIHDLVAADGQIFRNVQVRKIEPDGLTIRHEAGLTKLEFLLLPEEWQRKYEYDPQTAQAYQRGVALAREQAERDAQAIRQQNAAGRSKQIQAEPIRVFEVRTSRTKPNGYSVKFSVRNNDDKARKITAEIAPMAIKTFTIPPNASKSGLEVESKLLMPKELIVRSGAYSTQQALSW